jgi:hypothetical protein
VWDFISLPGKLSIDDAAIIAVAAVQKNIDVYTQDAE